MHFKLTLYLPNQFCNISNNLSRAASVLITVNCPRNYLKEIMIKTVLKATPSKHVLC